jgi:hypothetical protein
VQKWQTSDIVNVSSEKSKHVGIEIGGGTPITLLFNVGKDHVEEIIKKLESSRELARPVQDSPRPQPSDIRLVAPPLQKTTEKGTVRFSPASPTIIPQREEGEEEEEEEEEPPQHPTTNGYAKTPKASSGDSAVALYDFTADGDDELSVVEGEELMVIERDGDEWWKCRNARGVEGVVPASYLELKGSSSTSVPRSIPEEDKEEDSAAEAARAEQEAADRAKAQRLQEEEEERVAKERKRQDAQRRAREADAAVAGAERQKRREAALASAKKSSPPR